MLVVVASCHDQSARDLAARWSAYDARLLTCRDLSRPGWRHYGDSAERGTAVIDGHPVPVREIRGVLTRSPGVAASELEHIVPSDRAYVAAEMTAFLVFWLYGLSCRVLNRPSAQSLKGPGWQPEQWVSAAARLGIPVLPIHKHIGRAPDAPEPLEPRTMTATVVGERVFGPVDEELAHHARILARAANVDLLRVHFGNASVGSRLVAADLAVDVNDPEVQAAILEHFLAGDQ